MLGNGVAYATVCEPSGKNRTGTMKPEKNAASATAIRSVPR